MSAFGDQGIYLLEHLFHAPADFLALFFQCDHFTAQDVQLFFACFQLLAQPAGIALRGGLAFTSRLQQFNGFVDFFFQRGKIVVEGPCFRLSFHFTSKFQ
jgi:hypothetical protein